MPLNSSTAATVTKTLDFTDSWGQNPPNPPDNKFPITLQDVVFDDGFGNTVTVDITLDSDVFGDLVNDGDNIYHNAGRVAWFDNRDANETAIWTVALDSVSSGVDASSIEFKIDSMGLKIEHGR